MGADATDTTKVFLGSDTAYFEEFIKENPPTEGADIPDSTSVAPGRFSREEIQNILDAWQCLQQNGFQSSYNNPRNSAQKREALGKCIDFPTTISPSRPAPRQLYKGATLSLLDAQRLFADGENEDGKRAAILQEMVDHKAVIDTIDTIKKLVPDKKDPQLTTITNKIQNDQEITQDEVAALFSNPNDPAILQIMTLMTLIGHRDVITQRSFDTWVRINGLGGPFTLNRGTAVLVQQALRKGVYRRSEGATIRLEYTQDRDLDKPDQAVRTVRTQAIYEFFDLSRSSNIADFGFARYLDFRTGFGLFHTNTTIGENPNSDSTIGRTGFVFTGEITGAVGFVIFGYITIHVDGEFVVFDELGAYSPGVRAYLENGLRFALRDPKSGFQLDIRGGVRAYEGGINRSENEGKWRNFSSFYDPEFNEKTSSGHTGTDWQDIGLGFSLTGTWGKLPL